MIMEVLGVPAGPIVGQAYQFLLGLRMEHGPMAYDAAVEALRAWARDRPPGRRDRAGEV